MHKENLETGYPINMVNRTAESYEAEIKELEAKCKALKYDLDEARADKASAELEAECYKTEIAKNEIRIEFMRGQIEAFKFCIACGKKGKNAE